MCISFERLRLEALCHCAPAALGFDSSQSQIFSINPLVLQCLSNLSFTSMGSITWKDMAVALGGTV